MAVDRLFHNADNIASPARRATPITPNDATQLTIVPKAIYVGTGGAITMRGVDDTADIVWKNIPSGAILPFRAVLIKATGTTAADMLALD